MLSESKIGSPEWIKGLRSLYGLTQSELAARLGVTLVTISRWENGQSRPNNIAIKSLSALAFSQFSSIANRKIEEPGASYEGSNNIRFTDFRADPLTVRLFVEGQRLQFGHLFSPSLATETALVDALPHQIIAVYNNMLPQAHLRFLLADDAGAGKTIMAGIYIREMLNRRLIRRVLIIPPAGLVGNWKRELRTLFSMQLREVTGFDCREENPFAGPGSDLAIISIDTLSGGRALDRLSENSTEPYDLVIFDEAHKLAASENVDKTINTTERYRLAELLAGAEPFQSTHRPANLGWHAQHLLLLTATPHMGKSFPYYALWRLLEPDLLRTEDAFINSPIEFRNQHFIRRTKEEMVRFDGSRIFPPRISQTASYDLTAPEWELYEALTSYVRVHFNKASILNRSSARLAMSVLQRRAASSTKALLRSLERRRDKLADFIEGLTSQEITQQQFKREQERPVTDTEETTTSDEEASTEGNEELDNVEDEAMSGTTATTVAELQAEYLQVEGLLGQAKKVFNMGRGQESKFDRLVEVIQDSQFKNEKLLIFTEHRDTMDYLVERLEGMGYTGQVARIHGGMPYPEREIQMDDFKKRCRFMVATDAAGEGINLQFCWIMVNYDIPWNPARIEQRFGRIHRYGQKHDHVVLLNLVANRTREGKVLKTLLEKLETIRKELHSDKVFDVIGRQFQGLSLVEIIMRAVVDDSDAEAITIDSMLTREQVKALEETEAKLVNTGGDVASLLPGLIAQRENNQLRYLLPGYVRGFVEDTAKYMGIRIRGDINGQFYFEGLPLPLATALGEALEGTHLPIVITRPNTEDEVLFLRPGEQFFDFYRQYFCNRVEAQAIRGASFTDPYATEPYLFHLAIVTTIRGSDIQFPKDFKEEQVVDVRLVALKQKLNGQIEECPVELLLALRPLILTDVSSIPADYLVSEANKTANSFLIDAISKHSVENIRHRIIDSLPTREEFINKGFDYQAAELAAIRTKLGEYARSGDRMAIARLEEVRQQQQMLTSKKESLLAVLKREPDLIGPGEIKLLAHALILPSKNPEDKERYDREIELIAVQIARIYEEKGARANVTDVSTPNGALQAGLGATPGFDLLSKRPDGTFRCIEVKGRRGIGDIELTENEWARSANLRRDYWLYVVYDCVTSHPSLFKVRDPFGNLFFHAKGGVIIDEAAIFKEAETEQANEPKC